MKKTLSLILTFAIFITFIPALPAEAAAPDFEEYILSSLADMKTEIDVLSYVKANGWTGKQTLQKYQEIVFKNPQVFYTDGSIGYKASVYSNGTFASFKLSSIKYSCTKSEMVTMTEAFNKAVEKALSCISDDMSDEEKALAIHDYIAVNTAYDTSLKKYNAYNCLVENSAVCQGYSLAYKYLMNKCGVECEVITSASMNHAWNYVKIGSNWYHVDVTMDDPMTISASGAKSDVLGKVTHEYLLISDKAIKNADFPHEGWTLGSLPSSTSTIYDDFFWRCSESRICNIGSKWYFLDFNENSPGCDYKSTKSTEIQTYLKSYTFSTKKISTIFVLKATWNVWNNARSWYPASYARLDCYNGTLYFNSNNTIRSYKPGDSAVRTYLKPSTSKGYVYGLRISDGTIYYSIKTSPDLKDSSVYSNKI